MCGKVCVCLNLFVHMFVCVYENVVICACPVSKTFVGKFVQLFVCNSVHTLILSVYVIVYINEGMDA